MSTLPTALRPALVLGILASSIARSMPSRTLGTLMGSITAPTAA